MKKHLILLHSALGTGDQLTSLAEKLSDTFHLHMLNFTGHGIGSTYSDPLTMDLFCNDVLEYMTSNGLDKALFFGYSMGGYVAVRMGVMYPGKVEKIFTLATVFDWSTEKASKESAMLNPEKIEQKVPAFAKGLQKLHGEDSWKSLVVMTGSLMKHLGDDHLTEEDFGKVQCPVRIAVGDRDQMAGVAPSHQVSKWIASGSLLVLPETPHPFESVNLERLVYELKCFF
jgi:pimeloyl-ACP methyl ester carboxylesterase